MPDKLKLEDVSTLFNELRVAQRTPIIELNAVNPLTTLRDDQQTSGTGAITDETSEFRVRHQASGDFASLRSSARGRYLPGLTSEAGIGVRADAVPTSGDGQIIWGYFDMEVSGGVNQETIQDGAVFGYDTGGYFVAVYKSGVEKHKTYKQNWNKNPNIDIDITNDAEIFQIVYSYYGNGSIVWQMLNAETGSDSNIVNLHIWNPTNETSLDNSNLQVGALVKSSNTSEDFSIYVQGRQFSLVGTFSPVTRLTTETVTGVTVGTSSFVPLVSFRRKANFRSVSIDLQSFDVLSDNDLILRIDVKTSLTSGSFGSISNLADSETSLEVDTSATSYSNGVNVYEALILGGTVGQQNNISSLSDLPQNIPDEAIVTFSAKAIDTSATVSASCKMREEF